MIRDMVFINMLGLLTYIFIAYLTIAPAEAPTNTVAVARATPGPNPTAFPSTNPIPKVSILPGTKQTVAIKYTPILST